MSETAPFLGIRQSLSDRCWRLRCEDDRLALAMAQRFDMPEVMGRVLAARGVGLDDCERFLEPTLRQFLPDPSLLRDMDRAVQRLIAAIEAREEIAVFGDYDVDGATSGALLVRYLRAIGRTPAIYVPDRQREGYGPNAPALLALKQGGIKVVITVDCGIAAHDALAKAAEAGLDVIVADHHLAEPALPPAYAVVNPNRLDDQSGQGFLAAVGVVFLLVVAVNRELQARGFFATRPKPDLLQWLDLVALGTVCDVVPLKGVNRALVAQGLKVLTRRQNPGLAALADAAGLRETPGAYHLGYLFGPRVNAGGRVGRADLGMRLLMADDPSEAALMAAELHQLNKERQMIEASVLEQAIEQAATLPLEQPILIVAGRGWHPGVIGIVASRIKDRFNRPSFVIAIDESGMGKGSGRSIPGVDLGAAVTAARQSGLLINGGGHAMAAGLTVDAAKIDQLKIFLGERLAGQMAARDSVNSLGVDGALAVGGATMEFYDLLERAGPFGSGHSEPRFVIPACRVVYASVVGQGHVRCDLQGSDGKRLKGIAFRAVDTEMGRVLLNSHGQTLHIAGALRADTWQGERRLQLFIEDAAYPQNQE